MKKNKISKALMISFIVMNSCLYAQNIEFNNKDTKTIITKKRTYNQNKKAAYYIQLYNGSEKKARAVSYKFKKVFYWLNTKLKFESPDWKVKVGNYQTRLEADRALNDFRRKFPSSIIIKK